ncbi:MAG: glycosyltransferase, partial [Melioribacteraceae bacterium]|nr:glycosyltransferase [Melioribacteraceae bacterium]
MCLIILNWKSFNDTRECIESLLHKKIIEADLFVVDNASGTNEELKLNQLKLEKPFIQLRLNKTNLGFTKAHNKLFEELINDYKYFFLLNNDTIVDENLISILSRITQTNQINMLSCKMINYWDHALMDNAGHKMLTSGEIVAIGRGQSIETFTQKFENTGACAGAAVYSSKMLKDIGLFDEYFETGYEDAEIGLRAFIAGYSSVFVPQAVVYHKMGQSIKKVFNYDYKLKTQCNIFYTYLKLVHWQVILINFFPWLLRLLIITLIDILLWRREYLKIQYQALYIIFFRDWKGVWNSRKKSKRLRRIPWWKLIKMQEFYLKR